MTLQQARRKKEFFFIQIRKENRERIFHQTRSKMVKSLDVDQAFSHFIKNRSDEVPTILVRQFNSISPTSLALLYHLIHKGQIEYLNRGNGQFWFFDCTNYKNIKFMSHLCKSNFENILSDFYSSTIQAYKSYNELFIKLKQQVKQKKCLSSIKATKQSEKLMELQSPNSIQTILSLLQFWQGYIDLTKAQVKMKDVQMMLSHFEMFVEFSNILHERVSSQFLKTILNYIKVSKILSILKQNQRQPFANYCLTFVKKSTSWILTIVRKAVDYRCQFYQIMEIFLEFYQLSTEVPGLFYTVIYECSYLKEFTLSMLRSDDHNEGEYNKRVTLKFIHLIDPEFIYASFTFAGAHEIVRVLALQLMLSSENRIFCILVLYNYISCDEEQYLLKYVQLIDYKLLLEDMKETQAIDIFQFIIKILEIYKYNPLICRKVIEECQLQDKMKMLCLQNQNQSLNKENNYLKVYGLLVKLVKRNVDFFIDNYPKLVNSMYEFAKEMQFQGSIDFVNEMEGHVSLHFCEKNL